ncbi:LacI family DNA-binding transcriptional regulator [Glycomyces luteolus]|uniref:LacI family DNA-binding transcriptional regulator n=1 Tax=Glycomyces luteolus TaxID=2670330 RepID=UPI0038CBF705
MSTSRSARQPTVKEVATRAGVSPMTVSRTLAGGVNVPHARTGGHHSVARWRAALPRHLL